MKHEGPVAVPPPFDFYIGFLYTKKNKKGGLDFRKKISNSLKKEKFFEKNKYLTYM